MEQSFDRVARDYDRQFSDTLIGIAQREVVYRNLDEGVFSKSNKPLRILELSCGTGVDACRFAREGHEVLATDASEGMLAMTRQKAEAQGLQVDTLHCRIEEIPDRLQGQRFDLIFSNFGGLNGVNLSQDAGGLAKGLADLLQPGGKLILVVMSRFCLWENLYFLLKLRLRAAFRRRTRSAVRVPLGDGEYFDTWYYGPRDLIKVWGKDFRKKKVGPIGFFVPPSYLEPFFKERPRFLRRLSRWETRHRNRAFLAPLSDHFYLELEKIE